ncbi:DUF7739 domain-containing protein [Streptomyces hydrogenans]|uniref:DUF7739 domain-containing protein n=1 Tax=Streptomyces hydrogenans TaxID=1873719 RepID=UPI0033D41FDB
MTSHLIVSHGADFFGQDRHELPALAALAPYVRGTLPVAEYGQLVHLLEHAADGHTIKPAVATVLADQLLRVSRARSTPTKASRLARLLADSAGRAAADGQSWTWTVTIETEIAA